MYVRSNAKSALGDHQGAIADCTAAVELDPTNQATKQNSIDLNRITERAEKATKKAEADLLAELEGEQMPGHAGCTSKKRNKKGKKHSKRGVSSVGDVFHLVLPNVSDGTGHSVHASYDHDGQGVAGCVLQHEVEDRLREFTMLSPDTVEIEAKKKDQLGQSRNRRAHATKNNNHKRMS